jgi:hypothetical protein
MLRHSAITTRTVLVMTTLMGLVAIAHAVTLHRCIAHEPVQSQSALVSEVVEPASGTCDAASYPAQLSVLLEGFVYSPLVELHALAATHDPA